MARVRPQGAASYRASNATATDRPGTQNEEDVGLLSANAGLDEEEFSDDGVIIHAGTTPATAVAATRSPLTLPPGSVAAAAAATQVEDPAPSPSSALRTPRTPRTPNRVRFDLRPTIVDGENGSAVVQEHHHHARESFDIDDEDPLNPSSGPARGRRGSGGGGRVPLLSGIEAPAVALANSPWSGEGVEGDLDSWAEAERARPKSGLRMAFMNMANSIIGAGIIGQPYAFKQAGLLAGIILLMVLTVVVDWTICLIVVNSKLSGATSFQGTVEKCFGKPGLIAISVAQWVFAFGGMVAFGVIVGDSIPHVLAAVWPGLKDMPVLGLLADRRAVIVVFTLGVSYPLALYRDIAKVSRISPDAGYGYKSIS